MYLMQWHSDIWSVFWGHCSCFIYCMIDKRCNTETRTRITAVSGSHISLKGDTKHALLLERNRKWINLTPAAVRTAWTCTASSRLRLHYENRDNVWETEQRGETHTQTRFRVNTHFLPNILLCCWCFCCLHWLVASEIAYSLSRYLFCVSIA